MGTEWHLIYQELSKITVRAHSSNSLVSLSDIPDCLSCIGVGTDAAVFRHANHPKIAFKVYAKEKSMKMIKEQWVYQRLGESIYFPKYYDAKEGCLVLSYEEGLTLYECLNKGIHIPNQAVADVEQARRLVRERGLNPRDIHLRNIILQNGRAKIIDLSEFMEAGNDFRWEHLKKAYDDYYHLIDGKPLPYTLLETIKNYYNQSVHIFSYEEIEAKLNKLLTFVCCNAFFIFL